MRRIDRVIPHVARLFRSVAVQITLGLSSTLPTPFSDMKLRAKTLAELRETLDSSYFTADSFQVKTVPDGFPFLEIEFIPARHFFYRLYIADDNAIRTEESPGKLIATAEERLYKNLEDALGAVRYWTRRIREEYTHAAALRSEVDEFLEQFRAKVFVATEGEDPSAEFSAEEINELRESLDRLTELVTAQAEELKANSYKLMCFSAKWRGSRLISMACPEACGNLLQVTSC